VLSDGSTFISRVKPLDPEDEGTTILGYLETTCPDDTPSHPCKTRIFSNAALKIPNLTYLHAFHPYILNASWFVLDLLACFNRTCGPGSVVGIATGYGLDGPRIETLWVARFSAPVRQVLLVHNIIRTSIFEREREREGPYDGLFRPKIVANI